MNFVNTQYLLFAMGAIFLIFVLLNRLNAHFFKWIKSYWFFERTWFSKISSFFYLLSLFLFMISLLDLRGPEKKVRASLPDQQTIIMIDTSTSMLSEDVRPSRFSKSIQLARHFVKSAVGHQISIVLFSDIQKRLLPFTDDIDLIDSRLAALEKMNSVSGGSNISQAIEESLEYFNSSEDEKVRSGNMLVFTDAEESEGEFKVHIPTDVNLAIVGVGTLKGGNIPLRFEDGAFRGYKTFKGEQVITKLDEEYLKKMGKGVKKYKYWIANSYSLPTEDLKNFFKEGYMKKQGMGDVRVRPVYSHFILIPAIIFYCLSVVVGRLAMFKVARSIVFLFFIGVGAQNIRAEVETIPKEHSLSPQLKSDVEKIRNGQASREFTLKVAEKMLIEKQEQKAAELYSEYAKKNDSEEIRFNQATAYLKSNRLQEALPLVQELMQKSKNEDLKNKLRNNVLIAMDQSKKKEKEKEKEQEQKKKEEKQEDKDNKQDQDQDQNQKNSKENKENKDQSSEQSGNKKENNGKSQDSKDDKTDEKQGEKNKNPEKDEKKENKNNEDKGKNKNEEKKEEKGKEETEGSQDDPMKNAPRTLEEKENEIKKKRKMVKTPAMIKQIMSDDRELQKRLMDTSTNQRGEQKPKRDW